MYLKKLGFLLFIFGVALSLTSVTSDVYASHSWGNYHWARTSNPFTLKLGDNLSASWDPYLTTTSNDWSISSVLNTTIVSGGTNPKNCRATTGRIEICNNRYGNNGWLGIAQIWVNGNHITKAATKVNDYYFSTPTYNTPAWKNFVLCQEVGHAFGLDHQDEDFNNAPLSTCMDYTSDPTPNQHPNQHDYSQLESIYAHLDGFTTIQSGTQKLPLGLTIKETVQDEKNNYDNPSDWGKQINNNKHLPLFELDLGNNNKLFTFVIRAQE